MQNSSTLQNWHDLDLAALKKAGSDEWHGPCPASGEGKDCFWVKPDAQLIGCRSCSLDGSGKLDPQQFKEHLEALDATVGATADALLSYDWLDHASGETVTQTRHTGEPKYRWPKGTKTGTLVYLERHERESDRPVVFCEGAKAATAAASKLQAGDYDVIGFVSSTVIPSADTLATVAKGRACVVWPDADVPGVSGRRAARVGLAPGGRGRGDRR